MTSDFQKYRLADGCIIRLIAENDNVQIHVLNWRNEVDVLVFSNVIGFSSCNMLNASLSYGTETNDDPLLTHCCIGSEESEAGFQCFSFFSSWTDLPILKIIASSYKLGFKIILSDAHGEQTK